MLTVRAPNRWIGPVILVASGLFLWLIPAALVSGGAPPGADHEIADGQLGPDDNVTTSEIANRPPFRPDRRPVHTHHEVAIQPLPNRPARRVEPAAPSTADLILLGTMLGPDGGAALIRSRSLGRVSLVRLGQGLGPWIVEDIADDRVRLRASINVVDLRFPATARSQTSPNSSQFGIPGMMHYSTSAPK